MAIRLPIGPFIPGIILAKDGQLVVHLADPLGEERDPARLYTLRPRVDIAGEKGRAILYSYSDVVVHRG